MNVDPSLIAIIVALSVGVATLAGAFAASLIIEATKDEFEPSLGETTRPNSRRSQEPCPDNSGAVRPS